MRGLQGKGSGLGSGDYSPGEGEEGLLMSVTRSVTTYGHNLDGMNLGNMLAELNETELRESMSRQRA
jgi:hypothetical protein